MQLVVLCADKPSVALLKRVAKELPVQLKKVSDEHKYVVSSSLTDGAVLVSDGTITVKVSLTSPLLRDPQGISVVNSILSLFLPVLYLVTSISNCI